jgi:disulfide oxidoreductase YuzD
MTAHASQGQTLDAAIVDVCIGSESSPVASYVALTRVKCKEQVLIYRAFDRRTFMKQQLLGPELLLKHLQHESIDWSRMNEELQRRKARLAEIEKEKRRGTFASRECQKRKGSTIEGAPVRKRRRQDENTNEERRLTLQCSACKRTEPDVAFNAAQRKQGRRRKCSSCIEQPRRKDARHVSKKVVGQKTSEELQRRKKRLKEIASGKRLSAFATRVCQKRKKIMVEETVPLRKRRRKDEKTTEERKLTLQCSACKRTEPDAAFNAAQRKQGSRRKCSSCVEQPRRKEARHVSKKVVACDECGRVEPEVTFADAQKGQGNKQGRRRMCVSCVEQASSAANVRSKICLRCDQVPALWAVEDGVRWPICENCFLTLQCMTRAETRADGAEFDLKALLRTGQIRCRGCQTTYTESKDAATKRKRTTQSRTKEIPQRSSSV